MINELQSGRGSVLNNSETIAELGLKLTLDNSFIRTVNDTLMSIDNRITDLETKTTELDLNGQSATFLIHILNDTLEDVLRRTEEMNFNYSERIHDLESSVSSAKSIAETHNISITDLGSQIVDLKKLAVSIQISSDIISELESDIQSAMSLIKTQNGTQTDLEKRITEHETASSAIRNISDTIREFDADLRFGISLIQAYNDTLTEFGNKISVLETN